MKPVLEDAKALAGALSAGKLTAASLTEAALAQISATDHTIRAFISILAQTAGAEAAASDARRAAGKVLGPLDGIPVAVKDNIAVAGVPTTSGTAASRQIAEHDATVVARLRAAGAVIIGTLNMHEGALGASTDNPHWGRCQNPLREGFTPGGSSGGSAAAIAGGMVPLTLGTDTMGSVRIPAAYCGLWGLKPTKGRIPVTGLAHLSWTLDSIGPLARSPADLGLMLELLEGPDVGDPMSKALHMAKPPLPRTLSELTFGVPDATALAECESVVTESFALLLSALQQAGARLLQIEVTGWSPGALRRAGLLISEVEGAVVMESTLDEPGLSDDFRKMLDYGRQATAGRVALAYRQLQQLTVSFSNSIIGLDGILLPTAPQRAFAHGAETPANQADFTALANVVGAPALSLPIAATDGDLPVGAQIIGSLGQDHRLVQIGKLMSNLPPLRAWAQRMQDLT
jgi:aspartyl-tRNA(Asn)/glutamyl-tRNA(Gln) amidotransferase subunit A